jgi:hypothetical protein
MAAASAVTNALPENSAVQVDQQQRQGQPGTEGGYRVAED